VSWESEVDIPIEERLFQLLRHLGIERAHFATGGPEVSQLAIAHPETIASLTLVGIEGVVDASPLRLLGNNLAVFHGERGPNGLRASRLIAGLPDATQMTFPDYFHADWSDVISDHREEVGLKMMDFLSSVSEGGDVPTVPLPNGAGEVAGITYRVVGAGPTVVFLPLRLAPSQWDPVIDGIVERYCVINLGGPRLGLIGQFERNATSPGNLALLRGLFDDIQLRPGETILDVGGGTGRVDRWLARTTRQANHITALDINRYLLREALALAAKEGLQSFLEFKEGNAEQLPFLDNSFDVTFSIRVMEEVDADKMMAEIVRVTKPAGRVAVVVRAEDMPRWVNLPLPALLKAKVDAPASVRGAGPGMAEKGCADASLYRRFHAADLSHVKMLPGLISAANFNPQNLLVGLDMQEQEEVRHAVKQAGETFFVATPVHVAVGTKL
jgi:SAM-dependent methyltransferase